jgi:Spy/CpxP family protein refolding chaperone
MNPKRTPWVPAAWALAALALAATPALAEPPGMGHAGMGHAGMGHGGMGHGGMGMQHGGKMGGGEGHGMRPHNAAVHFLQMADALGLDDAQKARLRKLRDEWIESNAANEARLKAAEADLKGMLSADTFDLKAVDTQLSMVGKVEGQLWHAFAAQLAEIKDMLTDEQRARLRQRHGMGAGMGMRPGMGMHR